MDKKIPLYCWEFHNCPEEERKKCPAFLYPEEKCWNIASRSCGKVLSPGGGALNTVFSNVNGSNVGINYCIHKCGWFKKLNPDIK